MIDKITLSNSAINNIHVILFLKTSISFELRADELSVWLKSKAYGLAQTVSNWTKPSRTEQIHIDN